MSIKSERAASLMIKELNNILLTESNDELFKSVTITYANITSDLSYAKIYFTTLMDDKEKLVKELNEASSFFRSEIAKRINLRHMPELTFVYDESIEYGKKIEDIINISNSTDKKIIIAMNRMIHNRDIDKVKDVLKMIKNI